MKVLMLGVLCVLSIACGKVTKSGGSASWETQQNAIKESPLSGLHAGKQWEGKIALMYDTELFDEPALSFQIESEKTENPCESIGTGDRSVLVTIKKDPKEDDDYDRYINFFQRDSSEVLASPNFQYKLIKKDEVITSIGVLFDIQDSYYGIEGYVDVVDCQNAK